MYLEKEKTTIKASEIAPHPPSPSLKAIKQVSKKTLVVFVFIAFYLITWCKCVPPFVEGSKVIGHFSLCFCQEWKETKEQGKTLSDQFLRKPALMKRGKTRNITSDFPACVQICLGISEQLSKGTLADCANITLYPSVTRCNLLEVNLMWNLLGIMESSGSWFAEGWYRLSLLASSILLTLVCLDCSWVWEMGNLTPPVWDRSLSGRLDRKTMRTLIKIK